jgi:hypothetical protein
MEMVATVAGGAVVVALAIVWSALRVVRPTRFAMRAAAGKWASFTVEMEKKGVAATESNGEPLSDL